MAHRRIDLVYSTDCPSVALARIQIREALATCGLEAAWREWRLDRDYVPEPLRDAGSPSVFVNGVDVVEEPVWTGRSCRRYSAPDGGLAGAPDAASIIEALSLSRAVSA
ncbi:MAG TPA: hypothetical protein VNF92_07870 [Gemmatimonadaceae bacterium]|nr:hypothetical protein [Gemmatimonadaceae bacterium]